MKTSTKKSDDEAAPSPIIGVADASPAATAGTSTSNAAATKKNKKSTKSKSGNHRPLKKRYRPPQEEDDSTPSSGEGDTEEATTTASEEEIVAQILISQVAGKTKKKPAASSAAVGDEDGIRLKIEVGPRGLKRRPSESGSESGAIIGSPRSSTKKKPRLVKATAPGADIISQPTADPKTITDCLRRAVSNRVVHPAAISGGPAIARGGGGVQVVSTGKALERILAARAQAERERQRVGGAAKNKKPQPAVGNAAPAALQSLARIQAEREQLLAGRGATKPTASDERAGGGVGNAVAAAQANYTAATGTTTTRSGPSPTIQALRAQNRNAMKRVIAEKALQERQDELLRRNTAARQQQLQQQNQLGVPRTGIADTAATAATSLLAAGSQNTQTGDLRSLIRQQQQQEQAVGNDNERLLRLLLADRGGLVGATSTTTGSSLLQEQLLARVAATQRPAMPSPAAAAPLSQLGIREALLQQALAQSQQQQRAQAALSAALPRDASALSRIALQQRLFGGNNSGNAALEAALELSRRRWG